MGHGEYSLLFQFDLSGCHRYSLRALPQTGKANVPLATLADRPQGHASPWLRSPCCAIAAMPGPHHYLLRRTALSAASRGWLLITQPLSIANQQLQFVRIVLNLSKQLVPTRQICLLKAALRRPS